jgi:predicted transport protein
MKLYTNGKTFTEWQFDKEIDFEREVVNNSKQLFGASSIYIDAKKKLDAKALGNTIPDGFLFDLSDKDNPEFYIVEVELAKHPFYSHIFPQITKFFGFFKNSKSQNELIEKIYSLINTDVSLQNQFKALINGKELYKFLKDTIESSPNVLLVIDGDKKELPEIIETYTETWGKMLTTVLLKKFMHNNEVIYTMHPEFDNIEFARIEEEQEDKGIQENVDITEEYHLEGVDETVKAIYKRIKDEMLAFNPSIVFNPQKYYLSIRTDRNIAYFEMRRKKINLVIKNDEDDTRARLVHHKVKSLSASIQKFYNGPSCAITLQSLEYLEEVIALLKDVSKVKNTVPDNAIS